MSADADGQPLKTTDVVDDQGPLLVNGALAHYELERKRSGGGLGEAGKALNGKE